MAYISDPAEYVEMMTDNTVEVTDPMYANQRACCHEVACQGRFS